MSKYIGIAILAVVLLVGGKIYLNTPIAQVDSLSNQIVSFELNDGRKVYPGNKEFKKLKAGRFETEFMSK